MSKKIYTDIHGDTYEYTEVSKEYADNAIENDGPIFQVNVSRSLDDYENGNGEGMWAIIAPEDTEYLKRYNDENSQKEKIIVKLLNKSIYYSDLNWGDYIIAETRGDCRPVAIFEELQHKYTNTEPKILENVFKRIVESQYE